MRKSAFWFLFCFVFVFTNKSLLTPTSEIQGQRQRCASHPFQSHFYQSNYENLVLLSFFFFSFFLFLPPPPPPLQSVTQHMMTSRRLHFVKPNTVRRLPYRSIIQQRHSCNVAGACAHTLCRLHSPAARRDSPGDADEAKCTKMTGVEGKG